MAKKRFYGDAVIAGASSLSVHMPRLPEYTGSGSVPVNLTGVEVSLNSIKSGVIGIQPGATGAGSFIPDCDAARIASIVVPAGVHAIIDFLDGRQFVCYCADKPVKVKPSMLSPAHAWRDENSFGDPLFTYLICDATGVPITGNGANVQNQYARLAAGIQVNVAVRSH